MILEKGQFRDLIELKVQTSMPSTSIHYSCEDYAISINFIKFLRALNLGEYQNPTWPQKTYCFVSLFHDFIENTSVIARV